MIFSLWWKALRHPKETFEKEKKKASWLGAIKNIVLQGLGVVLLLAVFYGIFYGVIFMMISGYVLPALLWLIVISVLLIEFIVYLIVLLFLTSGAFFLIAKALGGKGSFKLQTYLISLFSGPLLVMELFLIAMLSDKWMLLPLGMPLMLLFTSPSFPSLFAWLGLSALAPWLIIIPTAFYSLYPLTVAVMATSKIDKLKASFTIILSFLVIFLFLGLFGSTITGNVRTLAAELLVLTLREYLPPGGYFPPESFGVVKVLGPSIKYSDGMLEFTMVNGVKKPIDNLGMTLRGSGCQEAIGVPEGVWEVNSTTEIKATCDELAPGEHFSVDAKISYDIAETGKNYNVTRTIGGYAE